MVCADGVGDVDGKAMRGGDESRCQEFVLVSEDRLAPWVATFTLACNPEFGVGDSAGS
ncbi:MAG: hypothetical protein AAF989_13485 [Planctomycetota bacterium]